jgi:hypothetical protein
MFVCSYCLAIADSAAEFAVFHQPRHGGPGRRVGYAGRFEMARQDTQSLLEADPNLTSPAHAQLRMALRNHFGSSIDLPQIA